MKKTIKRLIACIAVVVMVFAFSTTAFAAYKICTLKKTNPDKATTEQLYVSSVFHIAAYNNDSSTDKMKAECDFKYGGTTWIDASSSVIVNVGERYVSNVKSIGTAKGYYREQIWSRNGAGGVSGVGQIFDY